MWDLKYGTNATIYKAETWTLRTAWQLPRGGCWGRERVGAGVSRYKLLYVEWVNNKVLPYSAENYIHIL